MNYRNLFASFLVVFSLVVFGTASAQTPDNCFDYYRFQSVQVSVGTEGDNFTAGDSIPFNGVIINENPYPVVDGNVFVRISEVNPDYTLQGHYAVDEAIVKEDINIDASSSQAIAFEWKAPTNLKKGAYRADFFFSVGKQFNLGGLPFSNEIIVGFDTFNIDSAQTSSVFLDRTGTKVDGHKYQQIGEWTQVEKGEKVSISQVIKNTTNSEQTVSVSYDLYYWDALNPTDLISKKTETVVLAKGQNKTLTYEIPKVERSVYYLKITAKTELGAQSILSIRLSSEMESPRINYFAATAFPLKEGEQAKIFSCFHNTANIGTEGKVVLRATDIKGNEVGRIEYNGAIPSSVSAKAGDIKALTDLTYLKLDQTLYDKTGKLIYQKSEVYDCKTLNSAKCIEMTKFNIILPIGIVAAIFLILSLIFIKKNKSLSLILLAVAVIFAVVGSMMRYAGPAFAEETTNGGKTKTETRSRSYQWIKGTLPDGRVAATGKVSLTHAITLNGNTTLNPGESISFSKNTDCSFNLTGGAWDTPYCGAAISFVDSTGRNGSLRLQNTYVGLSVSSSNSSILNCTGTTCVAGGTAGTVVVTATAEQSIITATDNSYVNVKINSGFENGSVCPDGTHSAVACGGSITSTGHKMTLYRANGDLPLTIASYSPSWTVTVVASPPAGTCPCGGTYPSCTPPACSSPFSCTTSCATPGGPGGGGGVTPTTLTATCSVGADGYNVTWNSVAAGGVGNYTYLWTGTDGLYSTQNPANKTYITGGTKSATIKVNSGTDSVTNSCSVLISEAAKCGTNAKDYDSLITEWPGTFCESGTTFIDPTIPEYGGPVEWVCVKTDAATEVERTAQCTANIVGPEILSSANCEVSQSNDAPNIPASGSIYSNRTAKLKTTNSDYDGYNFAWFDTTNSGSQQIGIGTTASTIFRTIGNKQIKLSIYKDGELGAVCTTSVKVIQKPTDVVEQ